MKKRAEESRGTVRTRELYFATLGFVVRRGKYWLLAVLFFIAYWVLIGLMQMYAPQLMEKLGRLVSLIDTFLLVFLFGLISGWNKRKYLLGQIGVITFAVQNGRIPENAFRTGLTMAQERFHGVGVFMLLKEGVRLLYRTARKNSRQKGELLTQLILLVQNLISLLVLMVAGLFAQLGACLIAYAYRYPETGVDIRSALRAGRHYFIHFWGVLGQLLLSILIWAGVMALTAVPASFGLVKLLEGSTADGVFRGILGEMFPALAAQQIGSLVFGAVLVLLVLLLTVLVTDPLNKIRIVRRYLSWLEEDGTDGEADAEFTRLREKLRRRVHGEKAGGI